MAVESTPPERNTPTGTSATRCAAMLSRIASDARTHSSRSSCAVSPPYTWAKSAKAPLCWVPSECHVFHVPFAEAGPAQRRDFGRERDASRPSGNVERLDPEPIARDRERPGRVVPNRQGEHPARAAQRLDSVAHDEREEDFRVRCGGEADAGPREVRTKVAIVVDLAVEDDGVPPVGGRHRLPACGCRVDDREAAVDQQHAAIEERAFAV